MASGTLCHFQLNIYQSALLNIPEILILYHHCFANLRCCIVVEWLQYYLGLLDSTDIPLLIQFQVMWFQTYASLAPLHKKKNIKVNCFVRNHAV
jgi:hypothetical protein